MEKIYRLPKEFATKWLEALRSGEYQQGKGVLHKKNTYCCIGVAASICGIKDTKDAGVVSTEEFERNSVSFNKENILSEGFPKELYGNCMKNDLVRELVQLNDSGVSSFLDIADWIEENVELY